MEKAEASLLSEDAAKTTPRAIPSRRQSEAEFPMAEQEDLTLARQLVEAGLLSKENLQKALTVVDQREMLGIRKPLREVVVELGLVSEESLRQIESTPGAPAGETTPVQVPKPSGEDTHQASAGAAVSSVVGGFRLLREVGSGALGTVWEAEQLSLGKRVAVKILKVQLAGDRSLVERFVKEAQAAARLVHPNIVQAIDAGEDRGLYYFAMEYVDGLNLKEVLARQPRLGEKQVLRVAGKVAEGLAAAAAQGFVHGDIKPANIMVTPAGQVKIADFGLARPFTESAPAGGTPHYMAPELVTGQGRSDIRSDLYSLGATMFHLLVGHPPFEGKTVKEILRARLVQEVPEVRAFRPDVSVRTARIVKKLLAKDPAKRPQSPEAVLDLLREKTPSQAAAPASPARPAKLRGRLRRPRTGRPVRSSRRPQARSMKPYPERDAEEHGEEVRPRGAGADHTFLYAGLGFGGVISLLIAALMLRSSGQNDVQQVQRHLAAQEKQKAQRALLAAFRNDRKEEEDKAREAFSRIRGNPTLSQEERLGDYLRLLVEYAGTSLAAQIAQEYDLTRGRAAQGAQETLEQRLAQARLLLAQGEPYRANDYLNDAFTDDEKLKLGGRFQALVNECVAAIEKVAQEAERKARALAGAAKLAEAKKVLQEAQQKVDPKTRERLRQVEAELSANQ